MIVLFAVAAAALLAYAEWRRADQRQRSARMAASVLAVAALAAWGMQRHPPDSRPRREPAAALLVTKGAAELPSSDDAYRFALPGAHARGSRVVPDVAFLRREFPEIRSVHIVGDGLEPFDLEALRGVSASFAASHQVAIDPAITFVDVPRELRCGDDLYIRGRVDGIPEGEELRLVVLNPDGSETTAPAVTGSAGAFDVAVPRPAAEGRFTWRIRLMQDAALVAEERFGIAVVAPQLPRMLVLESSPSLETTHLQRWYAEHRGAFRSRTLAGQQRYRFATTAETPSEFDSVDARLLAAVDVLLIDLQTFATLTTEEAAAIRAAVVDDGMGLLVLPRGAGSSTQSDLLPWKIAPRTDAENDTRTARLMWRGLTAPLHAPVALENFVAEGVGAFVLVRDSRGSPVVSTMRHGRGEIALSLARDTWQWRLQDQSATFAGYWSFLLSRLSKPHAGDRWRVAGSSAAPLVVNQPVELEYTTTAEAPPPGEVTGEQRIEPVKVPLAQQKNEPLKWRTTYWPRDSGWHRVVAPTSGAQLDFFVHEADAWQALRRDRRRVATQKFAVLSDDAGPQAPATSATAPPHTSNAWICFAAFLLSTSYLWFERRGAAIRSATSGK
jgi:hypothetical protein